MFQLTGAADQRSRLIRPGKLLTAVRLAPRFRLRYISLGGFHGHTGGNQTRREESKKAVGQITARVKWPAVGCKSARALRRARSNQREKTRYVCGCESEDWESCQEAMGKV